ncbi:MAG: glycosyltransferase family 2 protein [Candidatus Omnitrophota bacterium]|nr:MAG: glycosyltransferase family 2 protein [Candidatus Omnitrophota bacterium]
MQGNMLSIVVPLRGTASENWINSLTTVKGPVEFIFVYPPDSSINVIDDPRIKRLKCPLRGELIQRLLGLFNATGEYVLCIDDDQYMHPDIMSLTAKYFKLYPESWVLRLQKEATQIQENLENEREWKELPDIHKMPVLTRGDDLSLYEQGNAILAVPIAPLKNKFDIRSAIWRFFKRRDQHGWHIENFYQKVWRNDFVQQALQDLMKTMQLIGPVKWIPFWTSDRLLGLFIQAKFFKDNTVIGHWLPKPAQIITTDPGTNRRFRFYGLADMLLCRKYPQYGYFWNLFFSHLWGFLRMPLGHLLRKWLG